MISERPRNILVGVTMLVALAILMYGIILLGKFPSFGAIRPYGVTLTATSANGMTTGAAVQLNGVYAGQVTNVSLTNDGGKLVAVIGLQIDHDILIPSATKATLNRPQAVGNPFVELTVTDAGGPMLPQDGTAKLEAVAADASLIPPQIFDDVHNASKELSKVAGDLHVLLVYSPPDAIAKADPNDPNRPRENISTVVVRLNGMVKSLQDLLTDPALQGKVREAIQNIVDASAQLKTTLQKIDAIAAHAGGVVDNIGTAASDVSGAAKAITGAATRASGTLETTQAQIQRVSQQLVEVLGQIEKSSRELTEGNGTTGKLVNDPRLYDGLIDLSKSLRTTVDDLDFLIKKWKDEGLDLRLK